MPPRRRQRIPKLSDDPELAERQARELCLRLLTERARTRRELADVLAEEMVPTDVAARVLDRLEEVRLLDDAAYAEAFVRSRQRTGQSRAVVRRDLRSKGVSEEEADAALAEIDVDREREAALLLASRRAARTAGLTEQVRRRRLYGLLARRGYPADLVASVVAEVLGAADAVAEVGEGSVTEPTEADEIPLSESLS